MKDLNAIIKSAITSVLALTTITTVITPTTASAADQETEKCYSIVKAGMNDCETKNHSCAGSATKDNQSDAYLLVPKGLCSKIVGGKLTPNTESKQEK